MLSHIKILDLTDEKASFCSRLLADMGALVIKVEKPGGDPSRMRGPFLEDRPDPEKSLSFFYSNTNKLGITLNLKCDAGRKIFAGLVKRTDVVIESFPPGHLDKIGLGFDSLSRINPGMIMASITGFGQTGPRKDFKTSDLVASAFGGQMYVSGSPAMPPVRIFGEQSYYTASLFAAVGILLALRKRSWDGKGEHIDISLQEAVVSTLEHVMIRYFNEAVIARREGSRHWNNLFCVLRCKDGFIHLTPFQYWDTLLELMESEGMAQDLGEERWKDEGYRIEHRDHVLQVMEEWTKTHTAVELFQLGQVMRFPWAPVHTLDDVLASSQLEERGFFTDSAGPEISEKLRYPGQPYKFSAPLPRRKRRPPLIGEDNERVYKEELGFDGDDLKRLSSEGVI